MQIGSQVSMNEIGQLVGLDGKTVEKYIALLEQSFIIFRLPSFGRNLRNELKFSQKIFFYDCGIRNAIISDYRPIDLRQDLGSLFENYIISELKKRFPNDNIYFWRNKNQQEVDYLIEKNGEITAIEIKLHAKAGLKMPNAFLEAYHPDHTFIVDSDNYLDILSGEELKKAISESIRQKNENLVGNMASQGTTPRQLTDLIGSLCDLTSGSGDKGTPVVLVQGYFDNYTT